MKIHTESLTVFSTDDEAYLDYRRRTGRAEDRNEDGFWPREGYADFQMPTVPDGWKQTSTPVNMGDYWTWQVVEKTADELKQETYIDKISPRQCRLWLAQAGLLQTIEEVIAGMGPAAQIEWEYALEIKRDHGLVQGMQQALGKTDDEMHLMFWAASRI